MSSSAASSSVPSSTTPSSPTASAPFLPTMQLTSLNDVLKAIEEGKFVDDAIPGPEASYIAGDLEAHATSPSGEITGVSSSGSGSEDTGVVQTVSWSVVPSDDSVIWRRIREGAVEDIMQDGQVLMEQNMLDSRKAAFRQRVTIFITGLVDFIRTFGLWQSTTEWSKVPVSQFAACFLEHVGIQETIDFICDCVLDEVQYLLTSPNFIPEDLLQLPKISKEDIQWGLYLDIITSTNLYSMGQVLAAYVGSATSLGYAPERYPSGLIGRLISYFNNSRIEIEHDKWLKGHRSQGIQYNFRRLSTIGKHTEKHRVWWYLVETYLVVEISFNTDSPCKNNIRPEGTPAWVEEIRKQMGVRVFDHVECINKALPLRQHIPFDGRYSKATRTCANPNGCSEKPGDHGKWKRLTAGFLTDVTYLCPACSTYYHVYGKHRTSELIAKNIVRQAGLAVVVNECQWCHGELSTPGKPKAKTIDALNNATLSSVCVTNFFESQRSMRPIIGVHIPLDHVFACNRCGTSTSDRWFFEKATGYFGQLNCLHCHCRPNDPISSTKNAQAVLKKYTTNQARAVVQDDGRSQQCAGFLEYSRQHIGYQINGTDKSTRAPDLLRYIEMYRHLNDPTRSSTDGRSEVVDTMSADNDGTLIGVAESDDSVLAGADAAAVNVGDEDDDDDDDDDDEVLARPRKRLCSS